MQKQGDDVVGAEVGNSEMIEALLRIAALDWQQPVGDGSALEGVAQSWGSYQGLPPKIELLDDGRGARLLAALSYTRPDGSDWPVPAGAWLDGASIPRPLWSIIGGPFEGLYRNASIVHDHYCITKDRPWREVHRMFYEAMRCSGTNAAKARIMYYAVYRFGPRWPGALEAVAAPTEKLTDATATSFAADAEAIQVHGLDLDEIEALADARSATRPESALEGVGGTAAERARLLVVTGGSGTQADLDAVARDAALLPGFVLDRFERKKIRIIACRQSVTDFEKDLRGVTPRGWEATGRTWDSVPGAYFPDRKRVVIGTIADGEKRMVPTKASGLHGSECLIVHESLHGYDFIRSHKPLRDPRFVKARQGDFDRLDPYEQQAGQAGLEETFAESGARYLAIPDALAAGWPNLSTYWKAGPEPASPQEGVSEAPEALPAEEAVDAIGTAERVEGGVRLDLRAEGEGGAIGHAVIVLRPEDDGYAAVKAQLGGDAALEGVGTGKMLFRAGPAPEPRRTSRAANFLRSLSLSPAGGGVAEGLESSEAPALPDRSEVKDRLEAEVEYIAELSGEAPDWDAVKRLAAAGMDGLDRLDGEGAAAELGADHVLGLEAVIRADGTRPVAFVRGDYIDSGQPSIQASQWITRFDMVSARIRQLCKATGRLDDPTEPSLGYQGTAFLVGDGLVMTNRHVLCALTRERNPDTGTLKDNIVIDFGRELGSTKSDRRFPVKSIVFRGRGGDGKWRQPNELNFDTLDIAVLQIDTKAGELPDPLPLQRGDAVKYAVRGRNAYVVGFPGSTRGVSTDVFDSVFAGVKAYKRLAPGLILEPAGEGEIASDPRDWIMTHDASTLGGNSGSAIWDLDSKISPLLGIHFAGIAERRNWAHAFERIGDALDEVSGLNWSA